MNALEKEVLKIIGESTSSPDVFTDTDAGIDPIRDSLNDAIQELCMVTGAYQLKYFLPMLEDTWLYKLEWNTDYFGYITQAWDRQRRYRLEQTDLMKLSNSNPTWMQDSGEPTHYWYMGYDKIGIWRVPSGSDTTSGDGRVLELDCVCIPKPYTTESSLVKLRANYERASVYYAVSDFYASRGDARRAGEYFAQYLEVANLMKLKPQTTEQYHKIGGNNGGT